MPTQEKRARDLRRDVHGPSGPTIHVVVESDGKPEPEVRAEVAAAEARYPGRQVVVFVKRRE